ncbi:MAG: nuclear transport factor 2 family protein [Micromonosporaceae bacterium]
MAQPRTPHDVFHQLVNGVARLVAGDTDQIDRLAALYADDTHVEHPMSPLADRPLRTREEVRRHFAQMTGGHPALRGYHAGDIVIHDTADPEVIVAEFAYQGDGDQGPFRVPCVFVLRVRDGEIVTSRDYVDHLAIARITDRLDTLIRPPAAA